MLENVSAETTEKIFKPFLMKLSQLREMADRKVIAFIVAEDKNFVADLSKELEKISRENIQFTNIHSLNIADFNFVEGFDEDNLLAKVRELKFDEDEAAIILLAGDEILLGGNLRALADYTVAIKIDDKNISATEIWKLQDNDLIKVDNEDDEEDFIDNVFES